MIVSCVNLLNKKIRRRFPDGETVPETAQHGTVYPQAMLTRVSHLRTLHHIDITTSLTIVL